MHRFLPLFTALLIAFCVLPSSASARTAKITAKASYLSMYHGKSSLGISKAHCTKGLCADGIKLTWKAASCDSQNDDRYPPTTIVFTQNQKISPSTWPVIAPCSTGIELWWGSSDNIINAGWVGSSDKPDLSGLAICFLRSDNCSALVCVTTGCIPESTNGVDVFFQGGGKLTGATWLLGTKKDGKAKLSGSPNQVFWYGHSVPSSPFARPSKAVRSGVAPVSTDTLIGRNSANTKPLTLKASAPSKADGVDFTWFLPADQKTSTRGCLTSGGATWATFPRAIAYTKGGELDAPIVIPACAKESDGSDLTFNTIKFGFAQSSDGSEEVLTSSSAINNTSANKGCNKAKSSANTSTARRAVKNVSLEQPPAGTDGVIVGFPHDDYKAVCWTSGGSVIGTLSQPDHVRLSAWHG
jgi:hypothetical protein